MRKFYFILKAIYVAAGLLLLLNLYLGTANFFTTTYIYITAFLLLKWLADKHLLNKQITLSLAVFVCSFFIAEVVLRYALKKHVTYSELQSGRYVSYRNYYRMANFQFRCIDGRKDAHTSEFNPGQKRNYNGDNTAYPAEYCNALGTRGALPDTSKDVVFVMGDSFAEGVGTPADSTVAALLQKQWNQKGKNISVLNLGIAGFDLFITFNFLKKTYPLYKPKSVIVLLNTTDIGEIAQRGGKERFLANGNLQYPPAPGWEPLYMVSFVFRLFVHSIFNLDWYLNTPAQTAADQQMAIKKMKNLIEYEIKPWSIANHVHIHYILHPLLNELQNQDTIYQTLLQTIKTENDVHICNAEPFLAPIAEKQSLYWENDKHFTPKGYAHLALFIENNCVEL